MVFMLSTDFPQDTSANGHISATVWSIKTFFSNFTNLQIL